MHLYQFRNELTNRIHDLIQRSRVVLNGNRFFL